MHWSCLPVTTDTLLAQCPGLTARWKTESAAVLTPTNLEFTCNAWFGGESNSAECKAIADAGDCTANAKCTATYGQLFKCTNGALTAPWVDGNGLGLQCGCVIKVRS